MRPKVQTIFSALKGLITWMESLVHRLGSNEANLTNKPAGVVQIFQFQQLIIDLKQITFNSKTLDMYVILAICM